MIRSLFGLTLLFLSTVACASTFAPSTVSGGCPGNESTSSTSASLAIPAGVQQVWLIPSVDTYVTFGAGSATAVVGSNQHLLPSAIVILSVPNGNNPGGAWDLAYVSASSGTLNVCFGAGE